MSPEFRNSGIPARSRIIKKIYYISTLYVIFYGKMK